jgi:hypothetical protein
LVGPDHGVYFFFKLLHIEFLFFGSGVEAVDATVDGVEDLRRPIQFSLVSL